VRHMWGGVGTVWAHNGQAGGWKGGRRRKEAEGGMLQEVREEARG